MKKILVVLFALVCAVQAVAQQNYVQGKLTVILREQSLQGMIRNSNGTATLPNAVSLNTLCQQRGLIALRPMSPKPNSAFRKFFEMQFPTSANLQDLKMAFENDPLVEWASPQPAEVAQPLGPFIPNDPYMQSVNSWYLNQGTNKADINAPEAWEWTLGNQNIVIAICGGGIKALTDPNNYHYSADVAANLWTNSGEIPNNNIDDDHNGYIDDIHGWNFRLNNNDIEYKDPNPFWDPLWWHGTPMASHSASAIDNCTAVHCGVGVAPSCKIMGVPDAGASGIIYAADNGAKVLAYGWSGGSYLNQFVSYAFSAGMIVVNAGGNVRPYGPYDYPPHGISVAAVDSNNVPITITDQVIKISAPARYVQTSWTAPVVAGVVALMRTFNPYIQLYTLRSILLNVNSANPINSSGVGVGRVDAFKALKNVAGTPILDAVTGNIGEHPTLEWSANPIYPTSPDPGDPPFTIQFVVQRQRENDSTFQDIATVDGSTTTYMDEEETIVDQGMPPTTYYRIRAKTTYGTNAVLSIPSNQLGATTKTQKIGVSSALPQQTRLLGNYPNPFNPSTKILFELREPGNVTIKVFDVLGREVHTIVNQQFDEGHHAVNFNAATLASGVYYYKFSAGSLVDIGKMIVAK